MALSVERSQLCKPEGPPGCYPAHCSAEFGLSSPPARKRGKRPSGPAAYSIIIRDGALGPKTAASAADFRGCNASIFTYSMRGLRIHCKLILRWRGPLRAQGEGLGPTAAIRSHELS